LHHFSNMIKQANPRGLSALRLVLSRPAASDSLIAAVCRQVADRVSIVNAVEAAERFSVPPRQFLDEIAARPDFPAPLFAAGHRRIWRETDVQTYLTTRGTGALGRPEP
ncbi:MAG: hypothetical protein ACREIB_05505, partial [Pseudomonadota bacterium]